MRIATSCSTCRSRKKRCVTIPSGDSCVLCRSKKWPCDIQQIRLSLPRRPRPAPPSGPTAETWSDGHSTAASLTWAGMHAEAVEILDHPVMDELIELYFDMIHNKQLIVFHRHTFYRDRLAGLVPPYHLLGIAAIVARFSSHLYFHGTEPTERGLVLARQAKSSWDARQPAVSIQALQGTILLGFAFSVQGERDEEALLSAQALRMVQILQLAQQTKPGSISYEIEIRLFWHAFMMDVWHSGCFEYPRQLQAKTSMPLPLEEEVFENMMPADDKPGGLNGMAITDQMRQGSIMANVVLLHMTYADVMQLNRMLVHEPYFTFLRDREVQRLSSKLRDWLSGLPTHLQNTPENLEAFAAKSRGREFAVLHIIYHHQCQLLSYQYLQWASSSPSEARPEAEEISRGVARCKTHAEALSALMWTMNTSAGSECLWSPVNGHLLVVASSIHLHSLLFDNDCGDGDDALSSSRAGRIRQLLEQNFVMLLQFQKYWPTLKASLCRLAVFHRSCYRRGRGQSFRMDAWMFDFLTKHNVAMEEREKEGESDMVGGLWDAETMWSWLSDGNGNTTQDELLESLSFS